MVCDAESLSTAEIVSALAQGMARPARLVPVPEAVLRLAGATLGRRDLVRRLLGSLEADATKLRRLRMASAVPGARRARAYGRMVLEGLESHMPIAAAALSFSVCFALLFFLVRRLGHLGLDHPNARSLHRRPVPRTGGIAVLAGGAVSLAFGAAALWLPLLLALLSRRSRLADVHPRAAGRRLRARISRPRPLLVWYILSPVHPGAGDARARGRLGHQPLQLHGRLRRAGGRHGAHRLWRLRHRRARLGRVARSRRCALRWPPRQPPSWSTTSTRRGFSSATSARFRSASSPRRSASSAGGDELWPLWFPLLVFAPFIGDATFTLARRVARREPVWQAHRDHYYQRIVRMGLGHRGAAWIGYAAMGICALAALAGRSQPPSRHAGRAGRRCGRARSAGGLGGPALGAAPADGARSRARRLKPAPADRLCCTMSLAAGARLDARLLAALQPRRPGRVPGGHVEQAALGAAAARGGVLELRPLPRPVALREPAGPAAHPARRGRRGARGSRRCSLSGASTRRCRARSTCSRRCCCCSS